jgi:hypothetical protein
MANEWHSPLPITRGLWIVSDTTLTNVCAILVLRHKLESKGIATGADAICLRVVGPLEHAVLRTVRLRRAVVINPLVSIVAIIVAGRVVQPSPIRVNDDLTLDVGAAALATAFLPGHLRVRLGLLAAGFLSHGRAEQGQ